MIEISIPGNPIAKKRPRFVKRGNFARTYNEQQTEEGKFIANVLQQIEGHEPYTGPVQMECVFCFKRPKYHYGTGKNSASLKSSAPEFPIKKPDIDNCEKFVLDCLNDIVFQDDALVVKTTASKIYGERPYTEIRINKIPIS